MDFELLFPARWQWTRPQQLVAGRVMRARGVQERVLMLGEANLKSCSPSFRSRSRGQDASWDGLDFVSTYFMTDKDRWFSLRRTACDCHAAKKEVRSGGNTENRTDNLGTTRSRATTHVKMQQRQNQYDIGKAIARALLGSVFIVPTVLEALPVLL